MEPFGDKPLDKITVEEVEDLQYQFMKVFTEATVIKERNLLQAMMNRAVRLEYLKVNHLKVVEKLTAQEPRKRYLKPDEKVRLPPSLHSPGSSGLWRCSPSRVCAVAMTISSAAW
jgi:hypothetical protein